jgi:hypothetical protein
VGMAQSPWAQFLNPDIAKILKPANAQDPNIEELLQQNIDVVFTWDTADPLEKMSNAGFPPWRHWHHLHTPTALKNTLRL